MFRDFLYAYRQLKKSPVTTGVLMLALALGIGANASMFSSINSIILHPFPYPNLDRIMTVWETIPKLRLEQAGLAPANFADFKTQNRSFDELAAYRPWNVNIIRADRPDPVRGALRTRWRSPIACARMERRTSPIPTVPGSGW